MRKHTIKVFTFDELSDEAKKCAIDNNRDYNVNDIDWYDCIYEDAKAIGSFLGFEIEDIYFSGFASQGDGACFIGTWHSEDVNVTSLMEYAPKDEELYRIVQALSKIVPQGETGFCKIIHSGHYYHEFCTSFPEVEFLNAAGEDEHISPEVFTERETELITLSRDFMKWIYRTLEKQHDYLIENEQIKETLINCEMEFTEDGSNF